MASGQYVAALFKANYHDATYCFLRHVLAVATSTKVYIMLQRGLHYTAL